MDVQLLYFDGCPHWNTAEQRLREALALVGREGQVVERVLVETIEDAEAVGFHGSPTIRVDGRDAFATAGEPAGLACRLFQTPEGLAGSPTVSQLVEVLS